MPPGEVAQAATDALENARQARQPAVDALIRQQLAPLRQREADATVHAAPLTAPGDDRSAAGSDGSALDAPDAEDIPDTRGFRRTGTRTAVLDGTAFTLHAASGDDADTLLSALRYTAPAVLADAGIDTVGALRERLVRGVGDGEVPTAMVPTPTGGRSLSVPRLEDLGVLLDNSQRTHGILLGGDLPLTDLTPGQRLQVLLGDPAYADAETRMSALLAIIVHLFGAKVAVVDAEGEVTFLGDPVDSPGSRGSAPPRSPRP